MAFIVVGSAGFFFMLLFDWADSRKRKVLKEGCLILAAGCIVTSFIVLAVSPDRFGLPFLLRVFSGLFSGVFFLFLVFSLFLEIPYRQAYGGATSKRRLTTTGTYALARHPGVLWFFLFHLSLVPATGSKPLLVAVPIWTCLNIALVAVEDRIFFPRIFGEAYRDYQHRVPFLIPTRESVRRFISTFLMRKE
jgi:protein-S-isoprenylcysteine O-methyltransferase Ste14